MTRRLFHEDGYLREFTARAVAASGGEEAEPVVELDRTAFYPTSGGQPHDTGYLDGLRVIDVVEAGERILHRIAPGAGSIETLRGREVTGRIDWPRRFDHMQQHTGQHILSQAAVQELGAQTVSVHLGAERNTVDLALPEFSSAAAARLEALTNAVVVENRRVIIREMREEEAARFGLRRPPKKRGTIRVIEIEGFDRSACGGNHLRTTGEVGPIAVTGWERYKGGVRVEFLCGSRAVRDHRWKTDALLSLSGKFSVGEAEIGEAVDRLMAREREARLRLEEAQGRLVAAEADLRRRGLTLPAVMTEVVGGRDLEEVRRLAQALVAPGGLVALLAADEGRLVWARSADLDLDVAALLRKAAEQFGGRGGGRADFAQGSVAPDAPIEEVLAAARRWAEAGLGHA